VIFVVLRGFVIGVKRARRLEVDGAPIDELD